MLVGYKGKPKANLPYLRFVTMWVGADVNRFPGLLTFGPDSFEWPGLL